MGCSQQPCVREGGGFGGLDSRPPGTCSSWSRWPVFTVCQRDQFLVSRHSASAELPFSGRGRNRNVLHTEMSSEKARTRCVESAEAEWGANQRPTDFAVPRQRKHDPLHRNTLCMPVCPASFLRDKSLATARHALMVAACAGV
ncbi:hypothetical protein TGVEG_203705 [Toxoplasma gondii VEG]|uniref:Uncharacterized protein n=2 Tax=Toxoplasma gondii TaxID=5811 RepID=V4YYG4_TOXGV|nr:hypothetical protein TGVEG_203705 [Toxoplasma gondii VEG]KFG46234.1 hypothetical protein TGP89_203705 [Toxoplasma gondii p89]